MRPARELHDSQPRETDCGLSSGCAQRLSLSTYCRTCTTFVFVHARQTSPYISPSLLQRHISESSASPVLRSRRASPWIGFDVRRPTNELPNFCSRQRERKKRAAACLREMQPFLQELSVRRARERSRSMFHLRQIYTFPGRLSPFDARPPSRIDLRNVSAYVHVQRWARTLDEWLCLTAKRHSVSHSCGLPGEANRVGPASGSTNDCSEHAGVGLRSRSRRRKGGRRNPKSRAPSCPVVALLPDDAPGPMGLEPIS